MASESLDLTAVKLLFLNDLDHLHDACMGIGVTSRGVIVMRMPVFVLAAVGLMGCATHRYPVVIGDQPEVIVVDDDRRYPERRGRRDRDDRYRGYRSVRVPKGHYPPPGECRVWYAGRPPGHQPPPVRCDRLYGRAPRGAFILYNDRGWDADYDWVGYERRYRNTVPRVILRIVAPVRR